MLTLFSYPGLYGVADNNPYGLKVFAFLKLCNLAFRHEHILNAKDAPRGQLPYLLDGAETIGDSDAIISHLITQYALPIDDGLTVNQRDTDLLVRRMLDDLYWVMSYSRWKDPRFWPHFRDAILRTHPDIAEDALKAAQDYNFKRYHYQGIGRYAPEAVYARGIADLRTLADLLPGTGFLIGARPNSIDAGIYGFTANIYAAEELSRVPAKPRGALPSGPRGAPRATRRSVVCIIATNAAPPELLWRPNKRPRFGVGAVPFLQVYRSDAMAPRTHAWCPGRSFD